MANFRYIRQGLKAKGHTPIYKMHKYFARRPHNVFRHFIETYTKTNDIILDPFLGGGVTLFEGLATNRRIVGVDINPIASFVSSVQATSVDVLAYKQIIETIRSQIEPLIDQYYVTQNTDGSKLPVRWYELAYRARCSKCKQIFLLSDTHKQIKNDRVINGRYECPNCAEIFAAVNVERIGYELISVTYRTNEHSMKRKTKLAQPYDFTLMNSIENNFEQLIAEHDLWYPTDNIPSNWDRQHEDCLHRKNIKKFSDFYTKRSLLLNSFLRKYFYQYKEEVCPNLFNLLLFTFSAVLRYTNNMTISTGGWMDGRPVAWAKHAYWIPNQFVEVNPIEYLDKRASAIVSGMDYQQSQIKKSIRVHKFSELKQNKGTHIVLTQSSHNLDIPSNSIDAIITDPPYGSNVQYGELSHYWLVWLRDEIATENGLFSLNDEVIINRKIKDKSYDSYAKGLRNIFKESYRVLKPESVMVFTFNNKDMRVLFAVIRSAIEAGFIIEPDGIIYQEPIEKYKNTAHTRYAGSLHGDFIYTFRKTFASNDYFKNNIFETAFTVDELDIDTIIYNSASKYMKCHAQATTNELYIEIFKQIIPVIIYISKSNIDIEKINQILQVNNIESLLSKHFFFVKEKGIWRKSKIK